MTKEEREFLRSVGYFIHGSNDMEDHGYLKHCDGGEEPCYVTRCSVKGLVDTEEKVDKFIALCAKYSKKGLLMFSVTQRDFNNQVFRDTAAQYEGATITNTVSRHHGGYPCWLICIPIN